MKKILKITLIILLAAAVLCAAAYAFLASKLSRLNYQELEQEESAAPAPAEAAAESDDEEPEEPEFRSDEDVINILLVGVDNNYLPGMEARGNADGIIIMSLNKKTEKIIVTSVQRDTLINTPDCGSEKATIVYHKYGLKTLMDSLEKTFEIKLDNYVMVNYFNVINIIDAAGGVDVEIKAEELQEFKNKMENINYLVGDPGDSDILGMDDVGMTHLNGKQAAAYMRLRWTEENDFGRTARIRLVLSELKDSMTEMKLLELNKFADVVLENINTDMSTGDIMSLLPAAPKYIKYEIVKARIPLDGAYYGDGSYLYPDLEVNRKALHDAIYG